MSLTNGRIRLLPPGVVEKIAAGEVVERPASVVKELVENAIDAQSTKIDVVIEDGGLSFISVTDNGSGILPDDLPNALLRNATSKISSADDLFSITTMGFRGEALASVGAVSRLRLISSSDDTGLGHALLCDGGSVGRLEPVSRARGTTVEVRDLFFNVPARKKFMKSVRSESLALMRLIEQVVIAFPTIHFTLTVDSKRVLDTPAVDSPLMRISQIAGHEFAKSLVVCQDARTEMDLLVYVSPPDQASARARYQNLYVNLRRIDNDTVTAAIRQSFARFMGQQFRPSFFCFLSIDPGKVDINVHPTKKAIKFDDERTLFSFVYGALQRVLGMHTLTGQGGDSSYPSPAAYPRVGSQDPNPTEGAHLASLVREPSPEFDAPVREEAGSRPDAHQQVLAFPGPFYPPAKQLEQPPASTVQLTESVAGELWSLISCYQIHNMYILAPIKNGILLIDQHAAHERVLFEQALRDLKQRGAASQQMLFPVIIELTPSENTVVGSSRGHLRALGFEIEDFGGNSVSVSAIPAHLGNSGIEQTVRGIVDFLLDEGNARRMPAVETRMAAAFACGAAIKSGQKLDQEEMNALLNSLFAAENPYTCPHGRPTVVRISLDELGRRFLR